MAAGLRGEARGIGRGAERGNGARSGRRRRRQVPAPMCLLRVRGAIRGRCARSGARRGSRNGEHAVTTRGGQHRRAARRDRHARRQPGRGRIARLPDRSERPQQAGAPARRRERALLRRAERAGQQCIGGPGPQGPVQRGKERIRARARRRLDRSAADLARCQRRERAQSIHFQTRQLSDRYARGSQQRDGIGVDRQRIPATAARAAGRRQERTVFAVQPGGLRLRRRRHLQPAGQVPETRLRQVCRFAAAQGRRQRRLGGDAAALFFRRLDSRRRANRIRSPPKSSRPQASRATWCAAPRRR